MARKGRGGAMRKRRFNEEQIITMLKESEAGVETGELCRRHGITRASFYRWKSKYGGMEVSEARRVKQLEDENREVKHVGAGLTFGKPALKGGVGKKGGDPRNGGGGGCGGGGEE